MRQQTKRIVMNAFFLALLIVLGLFRFPIFAIPITLQLLVVLIIVLTVPWLDSVLIFFCYLLLGLSGAPIFALGGGLEYIYQPTFGFLLSFLWIPLPVTVVIKILWKTKLSDFSVYFLASLVGILICYTMGYFYAFIIYNIHLQESFTAFRVLQLVIAPFIVIDIIKAIVASLVAKRLNAIKREGIRRESI